LSSLVLELGDAIRVEVADYAAQYQGSGVSSLDEETTAFLISPWVALLTHAKTESRKTMLRSK